MGINEIIAQGTWKAPVIESADNKLLSRLKLEREQLELAGMKANADRSNRLAEYMRDTDPTSPDYVPGMRRIDPNAAFDYEGKLLTREKDRVGLRSSKVTADQGEFKLASERYEGLRSEIAGMRDNPQFGKPMVMSSLTRRLQQGLITQELFDDLSGSLPDDPVQLRSESDSFIKSKLTPEQQLTIFAPKLVERTDGATKTMMDENPLSPGFNKPLGAPVQLQVSPDAKLTDARIKSEGRLSRNNQLVIADRADARASAKLDNVKTSDKIASARLEETLQKTSKVDKTRLTEIDTALRDIDRLENLTTGANPSVNTGPVGQYLNNPFSADKQEVDKIQKKLANHILQEAKGAQTEGDAVRAERLTAITNMSDPVQRLKAMRQELIASRENATYAVQNAADRIDEVRTMGGRAPMGGSPARSAAPATQNQAALEWLRANPNDPRAAAIKAKLGVQ